MKINKFRTSYELWQKLKPLNHEMRSAPTAAENLLWQHLRRSQVAGAKFRRQIAIDQFIVDFYSSRDWIVVEVDGEYHQYTAEEDAIRQAHLESKGLRVIRFSNDEVMKNLEGVLLVIGRVIREERGKRGRR